LERTVFALLSTLELYCFRTESTLTEYIISTLFTNISSGVINFVIQDGHLENYACRAFGLEYIIMTLFSTLSSDVIDFVIGSKMATWQPF
jgi:hypothetical protein